MINNKFIIITCVYNSEDYIQKCIESVTTQNYDNFNYIVIDDCSTDNTFNILQELNKKYNFTLIRNEIRNGSALENIIKGIELISKDKEDILVIVDGDDYLYDNNVLNLLDIEYQDEEIYIVYSQFERVSVLNNILVNDLLKYSKKIPDTRTYRKSHEWLVHHLKTVKRKLWDLIDNNDLIDDNGEYYKIGSDNAWIYPIIEMAGKKHIKFLNKVLYIYNDINPICDMRINLDEQFITSNIIRNMKEYDELDNPI